MSIKLVLFDFDGVFTDGKCYFDIHNNVLKYYNIKDGMAIGLLKMNNIKCGLLSAYNTNKNILISEISANGEIINHLKFDYQYIGIGKKIDVLNKWMNELNITYDQIAYIGDDINDIEILEKVKFSACPNDAVDEVKERVKYICKNNGGNGCVREYINKILNDEKNELKQEIKRDMNYMIDNYNMNEMEEIKEKIKESKTVYFCGIGKSDNIANHCANLLKSISINAYYLNTINALHGDIGTLKENDLVILFSKSGNTEELIQLVPFLKSRICYTIGVCCDLNSKFEKICDKTVKIPFNKELDGEINKIPTNSYMSQLIFCNIIVTLLKKDISLNEYKENHPAGQIGNNLKKIKDSIIYEFPKFILDDNFKLHDIFLEMTRYKVGCCFFMNKNNELLGILTDGDIRRLLINDENKKFININDINKKYYYETDIEKYLYECKKINYIPIINENKLIGIINNIFS